jgi:hypothetical protein
VSDPRVRQAVTSAIASLNDTLPEPHRVRLEPGASLRHLESLAVTNLIVAVEDAVRDELGVEISLTDEQTLQLLESEETTPVRTVDTLVAHVARLVERAGA